MLTIKSLNRIYSHINLFRSISPTANFGININGNGDLNIDETGVATRLTITKTTGAATFSSGIGIGGATATTGGIQFPATAVAIADANNLDDYEEEPIAKNVKKLSGPGVFTFSYQNKYVIVVLIAPKRIFFIKFCFVLANLYFHFFLNLINQFYIY